MVGQDNETDSMQMNGDQRTMVSGNRYRIEKGTCTVMHAHQQSTLPHKLESADERLDRIQGHIIRTVTNTKQELMPNNIIMTRKGDPKQLQIHLCTSKYTHHSINYMKIKTTNNG